MQRRGMACNDMERHVTLPDPGRHLPNVVPDIGHRVVGREGERLVEA